MPMIDSLYSDAVFKRIMNAQAASSSGSVSPYSIDSAPVDVSDCEAFAIVVMIGAMASSAVAAFKLQHGDDAAGGDLADVEGSALTSMADTDDNKMWVSEVIRPRKKYINPVVTKSGGNVTIDGMLIIKYGKRVRPVSQDATVKAAEQLGSPASGTA